MKNLFQNKKILFTLILMASCFGILGVGGEIFAEDYRCDNLSVIYDGNTATANELCTGGILGNDCDDEGDYDYAFCVGGKTLVRFGCKKGWGGITCDCNPNLFEVKDCPSGCVNGKCKTSSTPPATACESVSGQVCCDEKDCSGFVVSGPRECSSGFCCKEKYCKCESVSGQVCCDLRTSNCPKVVFEGPRYCSSGTCCQPGSCVPKTTAGCTDRECNYSTKKYCDGGTWSSSKYCAKCSNHCGDGDCNCGETTTSCSADCGAPPAPIVPVIPQSGGGSNNGGGMGGSNTGGSGGAVNFINPLSTNSFEALIMGIINWILGIVVSLAILFLIIGGLMYITSAGDEERIKKAKNIILYAVVGLGVVILSWSIITELKDILGVQ